MSRIESNALLHAFVSLYKKKQCTGSDHPHPICWYNMLVYPISLSFHLARSDIEMKNTIYYIPFNISMLNRTIGELDQIKKNALGIDMNITITKWEINIDTETEKMIRKYIWSFNSQYIRKIGATSIEWRPNIWTGYMLRFSGLPVIGGRLVPVQSESVCIHYSNHYML